MSLSELKKYIQNNNRLPGMPSAQEVKENGMNVNEVNRKLVEKVEELTLYILELNKRIESLEEKSHD
jgi:hypothetical protein